MQSYNPLDTVIFGVEDVLVDVDPARTWSHWADATDLSATAIADHVASLGVIERMERGEIDLDRVRDEVVSCLGRPLVPSVFEAGWRAAAGEPLAGMTALVERLSVSLRVVALANTDPVRLDEMRSRGPTLFAAVDRTLCSFELGARKPDEAVLEAVVDALEVDPEDIALFDANPATLLAATSLGLRAFEAGDAETMGSDLDPLIDSIPGPG